MNRCVVTGLLFLLLSCTPRLPAVEEPDPAAVALDVPDASIPDESACGV